MKDSELKSFLVLLTAFTLTASAQTHTTHHTLPADSTAIHNVFWQPNGLHQGSPMFLTIELERPATRVTSSFVNKTITFFSDAADKTTLPKTAAPTKTAAAPPRHTTASHR